jgi:hypothetical protein
MSSGIRQSVRFVMCVSARVQTLPPRPGAVQSARSVPSFDIDSNFRSHRVAVGVQFQWIVKAGC